jgi:putative membrane protein insertion efficiency factor
MTNFENTLSTPSSAVSCDAERTTAQRWVLWIISTYRRARVGSASPCRFIPSCSQYALDAVETHGAARGSYLATRRILRCNPFGPHGVDLVPEPREKRSR